MVPMIVQNRQVCFVWHQIINALFLVVAKLQMVLTSMLVLVDAMLQNVLIHPVYFAILTKVYVVGIYHVLLLMDHFQI